MQITSGLLRPLLVSRNESTDETDSLWQIPLPPPPPAPMPPPPRPPLPPLPPPPPPSRPPCVTRAATLGFEVDMTRWGTGAGVEWFLVVGDVGGGDGDRDE